MIAYNKTIVLCTHHHTGTYFLERLLPKFGNVKLRFDNRIENESNKEEALENPEYLLLRERHNLGWLKNPKWLDVRNINVLSSVRHPLKVFGTHLRESIRKGIVRTREGFPDSSLRLSELKSISQMNCIKFICTYESFLKEIFLIDKEPNFFLVYIDQINEMKRIERLSHIKRIFAPLNLDFTESINIFIKDWKSVNTKKNVFYDKYSGQERELCELAYEEILREIFDKSNDYSELLCKLCNSDLVKIEHGYGDTIPFTNENI